MQESIVFLVHVQCRCKESSRLLSHLLMSFLFYVVSHLGRCVRTHVLTCYNISWLLSALTCKNTLYRPSIQHSAERLALVRWACPNLRLRLNVIIWHSAHLYFRCCCYSALLHAAASLPSHKLSAPTVWVIGKWVSVTVVCVSLTGALYCEKFVFSVVLGDDIVPRLSISSAFDLKIRLLTKLLSCDMPKVYCSFGLVYFLCFCLIF